MPTDPTPAHPMQPVIVDHDGVHRFKPNAIVRFLLDAGPYDLNKLALMRWDDEDREQLAQLIGYSVSGFGELGYVSDKAYAAASAESEALAKRRKKR
jgi:hypothetical protein